MLIGDYSQFIMALCVWREARGEPRSAKSGVAWVIRNRASKSAVLSDPVDVVLAAHQFSSFSPGDPNATKFPRRSQTQDWLAWVESCDVVENPGDDPTGGALYYESFPPSQLDEVRARQSWFAADKLTVQISRLRFYHG